MEQVKAEFVQGDFQQEDKTYINQYAVLIDGKYYHHQNSNGVSFADYTKAVVKSHPEYDFTKEVVMNTPQTKYAVEETDRQAVHPHKEEMAKAFDIDEPSFFEQEKFDEMINQADHDEIAEAFKAPIPDNLDQETGEIFEPEIINTSKTNKMEDKKAGVKTNVSHYSRVALGIGVLALVQPVHLGLRTISDVTGYAADQTANVGAYSIDKLNCTENTREDLVADIEKRTKDVQGIVMLPAKAVKYIASKLKGSKEPQPIANAV